MDKHLIHRLREECRDDFVGIWKIARLLPEGNRPTQTVVSEIIRVVEELLASPGMQIGVFVAGAFQAWTGSVDENLARLKRELELLGRPPDIGEVAWLVER